MDILLHLAKHSGEVVEANDLIDRNWSADRGTENALYKIMAELRRAFRDDDRQNRIFKTVSKRGYMLTLPVSESSQTRAMPLARGTDPAQVLERSMLDGQARMDNRDYMLAQQHFAVALELNRQQTLPDSTLECEAHLRIGRCVLLEQGRELARPHYETARELALALQDHTRHARALLGISGSLQPLLDKQALDMRHQLQLAFLSLPKQQGLLGNLLRSRIVTYTRPVNEDLLTEIDAVVSEARQLGDTDTTAHGLIAQHECWRLLCRPEAQLKLSAELRSLTRDSEDRDLVSNGYVRSIADHLQVADTNKVASLLDEFKQLEPRFVFQDDINRIEANLAMMAGRFDEAERLAMSVSAREPGYRLQQFLQLLMIRRFQGRGEEVLPLLESVTASYGNVPEILVQLTLLYVECGQVSAYRDTYGEQGIDLTVFNRDISWIPTLAALAELAYLVRDKPLAEALLPELTPFAASHLNHPSACYFGAGCYFIGLLYDVLDKTNECAEALRQALKLHTDIGCVPMVARTKERLAIK